MRRIFELKFGSHLFGTDTPNSDLDLKGIYLPTAKEICLGNYKKTISTNRPKREGERNTKEDVDVEYFSLDRYLDLLIQGQTVALDVLFAPQEMYTFSDPDLIWIMKHIYDNRLEILNKNVNAFVGYARQQAAKYGQKGFRVHALRTTLEWLSKMPEHIRLEHYEELAIQNWIDEQKNEHIKIVLCKSPGGSTEPHLEVCDKKYPLNATVKYIKAQMQRRFDEYGKRALQAESNEGVDWKALSHAVRVNGEAHELLRTGKITLPRPDKDLLVAIKTGQKPYKEVAELIEAGLEELKIAQESSQLRYAPNIEWANEFVFKVYESIVKAY